MRSVKVQGLFTLLLLLPLLLRAQHSQTEVPTEVKIQFMEDFISASHVSWVQNNGLFVASFFHHSHYKSAAYAANGNRVYMTTKVSEGQVPENVLEAIKECIEEESQVDEIILRETSDVIVYSFLVRNDELISSMTVDNSGQMVGNLR